MTGLINKNRRGYTISAKAQKTCRNSLRATDISAKHRLSLLGTKNKSAEHIPVSKNVEVNVGLSKSILSPFDIRNLENENF